MSWSGQTPLEAIAVVALLILGLVAMNLHFALSAVERGIHALEVTIHRVQAVEAAVEGRPAQVMAPSHGN